MPEPLVTPSGYGLVTVRLGKSVPVAAMAYQNEMIPSEVRIVDVSCIVAVLCIKCVL
jgi:hypothetical protein